MSLGRKLACFALIVFSMPLFAVNLDEVVVGAIYYHDEWNNNNKVRVLAIRGQKVEIIFLEGGNVGEIDRVYPRDLLTLSDSKEEEAKDFAESVAIGAVAIAAVVCLVSPESCENKSASNDSPDRSVQSAPRKLYFKNDCSRAITLAITFKNQASQWITNGWWNIQGNKSSYLTADGSKLLLSSSDLYYYAESKNSNLVWGGKDYTTEFGGRSLGMRKATLKVDSDGDFIHFINCPVQDALVGKYILGFSGINLESFTYKDKRYTYGVQVSSVDDGKPADKAGLKAGDVIYDIDGQKVESIEFLFGFINERSEPSASVRLSYLRDGELYSKSIRPIKYR